MRRIIKPMMFSSIVFFTLCASAHGPIHVRMDRVSKRIEQSPLDAALYVERALLHQEHGELAPAEADLQRSLELKPDDPVTQTVLARVLLEKGDAPEALALAKKILQVDPAQAGARLVEARALVRTGAQEPAVASFDALIDQLPRPSPDLILERSRAVLAADPQAKARALRGLERGIAKVGLLVTLALPAIELERELGRVDGALRKVAGLRAQSGRPTLWRVLEAEILLEAKLWGEAKQATGRARALLDRESCRASRANVRLLKRLVAVERALHDRAVARKDSSISGPVPQEVP